jgi:hypothetical protein
MTALPVREWRASGVAGRPAQAGGDEEGRCWNGTAWGIDGRGWDWSHAEGSARGAPSARSGSHLPQNCWGRLGGRGDQALRTGSNWRPKGPPLPRCAGKRGEFDPASDTSNCARRSAPPPTPPRSFLTERGEFRPRFGRLSGRHPSRSVPRVVATFIPSPACGRGCEPKRAGEGPRRTQFDPVRNHPALCPTPTSPSSFGGGGRVMRARRGRPRRIIRSAHSRTPALTHSRTHALPRRNIWTPGPRGRYFA